jgi:hypothetical protein
MVYRVRPCLHACRNNETRIPDAQRFLVPLKAKLWAFECRPQGRRDCAIQNLSIGRAD